MKSFYPQILIAILLAPVTGCGGSSDGLPMSDAVEGDEDVCANQYYQTMIGTWQGSGEYRSGPDAVTYSRSCDWEIKLRVYPSTRIQRCSLLVEIASTVTQHIVHAGDSEGAYECRNNNGIKTVTDPNFLDLTTEVFNAIPFPVFIDFPLSLDAPTEGPYFEDPNFTVDYKYLFDGLGTLVRTIEVKDASALELKGPLFRSTLSKVSNP